MEKKLRSELIKASESIKKKSRQLKSGLEEESFLAKKHFEPLIRPLETLIDLTDKNQKALVDAVKNEEPKDEPAEVLEEEPQPIMDLPVEELEQLIGVKRKPRKITEKGEQAKRARPLLSGETSRKSTFDEEETPSYYETVFEAEGEEDERTLREWETYLSNFGPLTQEYLNGMAMDTGKRFDLKFGPRCDPDRVQFRMGNTPIHFDNEDYIHIGGERGYDGPVMHPGSRGLFELIFKKIPDKRVYNEQDLKKYKDILELTSAHMQQYNPHRKIASSSSVKYNKIISPLFMKKGGALLPVTDNKIDYIHWSDPNELIDRLFLLIASVKAGNTAHKTEIASIEEELREANYIQ